MANCKFCGKQVKQASVFHAACWEREVDRMAALFCDEFCRFPRELKDEDALEIVCDSCPMIRVLNLGEVKRLE